MLSPAATAAAARYLQQQHPSGELTGNNMAKRFTALLSMECSFVFAASVHPKKSHCSAAAAATAAAATAVLGNVAVEAQGLHSTKTSSNGSLLSLAS